MGMQVPLLVRPAVGGALMKAHRIRKRCLEKVVVSNRKSLDDFGQSCPLDDTQLVKSGAVSLADQESLEGPDCPIGDYYCKMVIFDDDPVFAVSLQCQVPAEKTSVVGGLICLQRCLVLGRFIRKRGITPDMAVRRGITAAHQCAAILKDLDMFDPGRYSKQIELVSPDVDDSDNLTQFHPGESQIMTRREAKDFADATFAASYQQTLFIRSPFGYVLQKAGKVILKNERLFILRIPCSTCTLISWAKIAFWIV